MSVGQKFGQATGQQEEDQGCGPTMLKRSFRKKLCQTRYVNRSYAAVRRSLRWRKLETARGQGQGLGCLGIV